MSGSRYTVNSLLRTNVGSFRIYSGEYPKSKNVPPLSDDVMNMRVMKVFPDNAKSTNNRERKDHPPELIERNEMEKDLLLKGAYDATLKDVGVMGLRGKIILTNQFMLDIKADAYVNTANEALMGGGGTDLLIHTYAGPSLKEETRQLPDVLPERYGDYGVKCLTGDAKITSGHNLDADYIIHVVTPYLNMDGTTDRVNHVNSYKSVLNYVDGKHIRTIVIGPISTGYYGYPMLEAAILGLLVIQKFLSTYYENVDKIYLWIYNDTQYEIFNYLLNKFFPES